MHNKLNSLWYKLTYSYRLIIYLTQFCRLSLSLSSACSLFIRGCHSRVTRTTDLPWEYTNSCNPSASQDALTYCPIHLYSDKCLWIFGETGAPRRNPHRHGENKQTTHKGILAQPGTFLLWGDSATHWATMPPESLLHDNKWRCPVWRLQQINS